MKKILYTIAFVFAVYPMGCTYDVVEIANCDTPPSIEIKEIVNAECNTKNGSIEVTGFATSDLEYSADGENFQRSPRFENLGIGIYEVTARDATQCTSAIEAEVKNRGSLNIVVATTTSGCGSANGTITVQVEGGVAPYQYKIDAQDFGGMNQFENLSTGTYRLAVADASGCVIERDVSVVSGIVLDDIKSIISKNCATSSCHGGNISPDFRNEKNVLANASRIATRTGNKTMPPGGALSDEQIQSITCWVQDDI